MSFISKFKGKEINLVDLIYLK